jgi:hypothetical protein
LALLPSHSALLGTGKTGFSRTLPVYLDSGCVCGGKNLNILAGNIPTIDICFRDFLMILDTTFLIYSKQLNEERCFMRSGNNYYSGTTQYNFTQKDFF